jgi:carbon storage regulator CsrA
MLVLGRKLGQRIVVPQCRLTITVSAIHGNTVRLAVTAPAETEVYREEVWQRLCLQSSGVSALPGDRAVAVPSAAQQGGYEDPA